MDPIRSTHARVAALIRHRGPDDPEVDAARATLALYIGEQQLRQARLRLTKTTTERTPA